MRVAISSTGRDQSSLVDGRFGRAPLFVLVDTDTGSLLKVLDNSANVNAPSGAGISSAQQVCDAGADAVLTGSIGPKAFQVLAAAGVKVHTGATGSIASAVEDFKAGRLEHIAQDGPAWSRGGGMGRGGGRGQSGGGGGGRRGGGK